MTGGAIPSPTPTAPGPSGSPAGRLLAEPGQVVAEWVRHVWEAGAPLALPAGLAALALVAAALVARALVQRGRTASLAAGARFVQVLSPPEVDPAGAQALWANLVELLRPSWRRVLAGQPHLAFEFSWSAEGMRVGLWVPGPVPPGLVERAVESAWPAARAQVVDAAPPLPRGWEVAGGELRLGAPEWFPLRTDHGAEPLRALLGAAGGVGEEEAAAVQVLARPVTARRLARCHRAAKALRTGRPPNRAGRLLDALCPGTPWRPRPLAEDPARGPDIRAVLDKAAGPGWEAVVRYGVAQRQAGPQTRPRLRGRAHAVASAFGAFTGRNRLARRRLHHPAAALAARRMGRADLVSLPELAALAHLPTDVAVPGLARAGSKAVAPPPGVPTTGKVLGDTDAGPARPVALAAPDARYHLHLVGATGSGKSTLLTNLALADAAGGRGAVVIDPKGDLVTDILERLPAGAAHRVVLLDPDEAKAPPTLNVLEGPDPDLAVDHLVGIFRRIFEAFWGPRTDDVLRAACLTLLRRDRASLADVPRLLSDPHFRRRLVEGIGDPVGLGGFWSWYESMSEAERGRVIGPVMNKLRAFLLRGFVRDVVGTGSSSFDMGAVLDGGLCLVRVPKGILGDETARLLGSFVVAKVWQAATARARQGERARVDASLYVDECHNFLTLPRSFEEMLAEARGYRLSLVLAHQHLAQLPAELRQTVSANARTKVFFTLSPEDARALERHVAPEVSAHDLANLGAYQAAARLVVDGAELAAFTLRTRPAPPAVAGRAEAVRAAARRNFGRSAEERQSAGLPAGRRLPEPAGVASPLASGVASALESPVGSSSDAPHRLQHAGGGVADPSHGSPDSGWCR